MKADGVSVAFEVVRSDEKSRFVRVAQHYHRLPDPDFRMDYLTVLGRYSNQLDRSKGCLVERYCLRRGLHKDMRDHCVAITFGNSDDHLQISFRAERQSRAEWGGGLNA